MMSHSSVPKPCAVAQTIFWRNMGGTVCSSISEENPPLLIAQRFELQAFHRWKWCVIFKRSGRAGI